MIERVRSLTFELSNPVLTELGLEAAIERHLGREVHDKYGIEFELVRCELLTHLDENLNICLFRAVRELLNNIIKHAQAKKVTVSLSRENNEIIIIVADDGIGFDASEVRRRIGNGDTFGLFSVQEQLESFGGRLKIKSNPGQGSRFTIVMSSDATAPKS
jgi:signal transduction histidine kinase